MTEQRLEPRPQPRSPAEGQAEGGHWAKPRQSMLLGTLLYALTVVILTWPLARFDDAVLLTRQFDTLATTWLMHFAPRLLPALHSTLTAFPVGEDLSRLDSYVIIALAGLTRPWLNANQLFTAIALLGPVVSALAAQHCASRAFQVRFPWSLLAGLAYGFGGLSTTAWLEGHIYYLFNPWLPLLLLHLWRLTGPDGRPRDGLLAGLFWILNLLTTAYLGLFAALLGVAVVARALVVRLNRRRLLLNVLVLAATTVPAAGLYLWGFVMGSGQSARAIDRAMEAGSVRLVTLVAGLPDADLFHHSMAAPLGFTTLALLLFAPLVLRSRGGWRVLLLVAVLAVLLSLGGVAKVGLRSSIQFVGPMAGIERTPLSPFLHFPIRLMWLYYLCGGLVAAKTAQQIARGIGHPWPHLLWVGALVDVLVLGGAPWRIGSMPAAAPSAYQTAPAGRPILDLFAQRPFDTPEHDLFISKLTCYYQTWHERPILQQCIGVRDLSPQQRVSRVLMGRVLEANDLWQQGLNPSLAPIQGLLTDLGIGAVAVHADLFSPADRRMLLEILQRALGPPVGTSTDAGETLVVFEVPWVEDANPLQAYRGLLAGG